MGQDESVLADESVPPQTLSARSLAAVADCIATGTPKIVVLAGAGISTAAGIPDFRSPKTGLYSNLARLDLPYAEAVFDMDYFRQHPEPFYVLAQQLYPGRFLPTVAHAFVALLARRGLLHTLFTQNIDCLERRAGVPPDRIVEAHGSFATQRCIECGLAFPDADMAVHVAAARVPRCADAVCRGTVKPDIVFFGEALPRDFAERAPSTAAADIVLIMGTSLSVYPFAGLPDMAREGAPRVLFNMEPAGRIGARPDDVLVLGPIDDSVRRLADALGWRDELEVLWRDTVGDAEADRQLRRGASPSDDMEDEVQRLAAEVEAALCLDPDAGRGDGAASNGAEVASSGEGMAGGRDATSSNEDTASDGAPPPRQETEPPGDSEPRPPPGAPHETCAGAQQTVLRRASVPRRGDGGSDGDGASGDEAF